MPKRFCLSWRWSALLLLPLLSVSILSAQLAPTGQPKQPGPFQLPPTSFECRWTDSPIKIDGKADDPAWKHAQSIDRFYQPWLKNPRAARTATQARLLWDREYLYFFADMEDADLYADIKEHDGMTWENDVFELFFKPADDKPGYYELQVNAAGTIMDMFLPRRGAGGYRRFIKDGDFHIEAKVVRRGTLNNWRDRDQGWSVEGKIPWKDFLRTGGRPSPGEKWKFALCRYDYSVDFEGPELSTCAPLKSKPFADFHLFEDYATLQFVGADSTRGARPFGIEKRPLLTTSKVVGSPEPPAPYRVQKVYPQLKLNFPIEVAHQPGSDLLWFVAQKRPYGPSSIFRMKDEPRVAEAETLLDLGDNVAYSIAWHPKFRENGYVYIGWNGKFGKSRKQMRISRFTVQPRAPYGFDPKSEKVIIEWESDGHNGGAVAFGLDGKMFITTGDGTSDSDTNIVGQDMSTLLAKVLRIDVDNTDPGKAYSVPQDNPFVSMKGARPEIWALGTRNPWRATVDARTGHLWVAQNGQDLWEQAYLVNRGDNFGWSVMEGSHPFYPKRKAAPVPFVKPTVEHHHSEARSLTGGIVYYGKRYPDLQGAYIYGDYSTGKIWGVKHDGRKLLWHQELTDTHLQITGFGTDSQGEILICDHRGQDQGAFYTLEPTPKDLPPSTFPRKLSDSGLYLSVKGHVVHPALIPYSVNSVLWSDGASKERWIALPGDGKIDFTRNRGWNFPDGTVIVKSFGLELDQGNPASKKWIETRFLTRHDGEWAGYSYAWNDEQTEAFLVESKGTDREYALKVPRSREHPDGVKKQLWRYPSRVECMVCHSRAANWVLGLTELQMNKVHDYGGVQDHQFRVLEHLGVLRINNSNEVREAVREELKAKKLSEREMKEWLERNGQARDQRQVQTSSLFAFGPEKYKRLVDQYDPKQDIHLRARSYLHSNCSQCHVEAGGGNAMIDLEFTTPLEKMKILDVRPQHHTFDLKDARIIAPGAPERSTLLHRVSCRGTGQMPPLATRHVDEEAVRLLSDWIRALGRKAEKKN